MADMNDSNTKDGQRVRSKSHTFALVVRTAAALTKYILLHAVYTELGHTTSP